MMKYFVSFVMSLAISFVFVTRCVAEESGNQYIFTDLERVFGFYDQTRYSYCPSVVEEDNGTVHLFFCGNPREGEMVDNIYHVRIAPDGTQTAPRSVLQPGQSGDWDDHHVCDPSVVAGHFEMDGQTYRYALFFLGNKYGVFYNEIGVAFSNRLDGDRWIKYPGAIVKKTWSAEGDQLKPNGRKSWGVGQPSACSLDKAGKVLLTYTIGDIDGTRLVWNEIDCSDMGRYELVEPTEMVRTGLKNIDNSKNDYTCNADFAVNRKNDIILMIRPVQPHSKDYPSFINTSLELARMKWSDFRKSRGEWTPIVRITPETTGFPRNHNAALGRNVYGEIENGREPTVYYTVGRATPDVEPTPEKHAEWTYHIWRGKVTQKPLSGEPGSDID